MAKEAEINGKKANVGRMDGKSADKNQHRPSNLLRRAHARRVESAKIEFKVI